ncbi:hypothetical protein CLIBASIA_04660 [Candidatus Liberibacter asiaticus str. psy62]|uniref:Uncharacterized protein n=1 Tax=Liberibacter asiaticus (strain psy62) TaxID=537021 RepID=C6XGK0_LIBAP|nr:hypothetical protein CLIBASIA_04660 [Candidatus Liberibacter asiaticus str. psy62]BAP26799.1 hypothetical protein CGUJ_04660 [Candidatus Liberibacter asiaticus str. Ishi-1]
MINAMNGAMVATHAQRAIYDKKDGWNLKKNIKIDNMSS